jgi:hypothetical protein
MFNLKLQFVEKLEAFLMSNYAAMADVNIKQQASK